MKLEEVGKLLAIVASFDNRKLDESTALAWKMMLDRHVPEARLQDAQEVVLDWFGAENPYFEVRHLVEGLKKLMRFSKFNIESDVRSARARGLVGKDWPESKVLPWEIRAQLKEARSREAVERQALASAEDDLPGGSVLALEVGDSV